MTNKFYPFLFFFILAVADNLTECSTIGQGSQPNITQISPFAVGKISHSSESSDNSDENESTTTATIILKNEANHGLAKDNVQLLNKQKMKTGENFSVKYLPPRLTDKQIDNIAQQASSMITLRTLKHVKEIFSKFAPDSWLEALEDIPLSTIRCTVKVSTKVRLFQQQILMKNKNGDDVDEEVVVSDGSNREGTTKMPETLDQLNSLDEEEAADIQTKDQLMDLLKSKCPRGFSQIVALNEAINETLRQLPPHVHQIIEKYGKSFKNMSSFFDADAIASIKMLVIEFLGDLKSITPDEREQIGDVFPKLRAVVTDPKIDQLLDQTKDCVNGSKIACQNASKIAVQIWTKIVINDKKGKENSSSKKSNSDNSSVHFGFMKFRAKRQGGIDEPASLTNVGSNENNDEEQPKNALNIYSPNDEQIDLQVN